MLSGVLFRRSSSNSIVPEFVNQFILTDVYLTARTSRFLQRPLLPSIATLINPLHSTFVIILTILRTLILVFLSWLPGSYHRFKRIAAANTGVLYHDGRALATCESGPPLRVLLPGLETVGWFNGRRAENEPAPDARPGYGDEGPLNFFTEWTTGHPRVDPLTKELISFHATFVPPFVRYSIVPATQQSTTTTRRRSLSTLDQPAKPLAPLFNTPIPGVSGAKMMHDFGVSLHHTVIIDLPLTLDPRQLLRNRPPVEYDPHGLARFGVFPRRHPERVRWFETRACCIFHTANTWETVTKSATAPGREHFVVHMLACRLTSAAMVYGTANLPTPPGAEAPHGDEQCRLYYYQFPLDPSTPESTIAHQWALSAIPFDFPSSRPDVAMSAARYFYGCTTSASSFNAALGRAVKIDALAKVDATSLIARGLANPPRQVDGCVDTRSMHEVSASTDPEDPIKTFMLPKGWFAQEPRFVARTGGKSEDDGWLLSYVFDEAAGIDPRTGAARTGARSELWVIDAKTMKNVVAKVQLPQRVPYGLHGNWFDEDMVQGQRPVERVRRVVEAGEANGGEQGGEKGGAEEVGPWAWRAWMWCREAVERALA